MNNRMLRQRCVEDPVAERDPGDSGQRRPPEVEQSKFVERWVDEHGM